MKYFITKALDFGAGIYDAVYGKRYFEGYYKKLIKLAGLKGNEKVLDVGCGPGNLDLMIAKVLDKNFVYGIDIGLKMIARAKEKAKKAGCKIDYRIGNSTNLPYTDDEFDVVFTSLIYHHLDYEEKNQTLKEIHRVLKQNGKCVSFEFTEFPKDIFHRIFLRLFAGDSGIMHGLYPVELIEENGFYIKKEIEGPSFWKHHSTIYRVLVEK